MTRWITHLRHGEIGIIRMIEIDLHCMSMERLKLGDVEIHQGYLQVYCDSVACLNALWHHRFGSGVSRKWGWVDHGLPKNWQEIY